MILIIEDDKDIQDLMVYILRDEGFQVVALAETISLQDILERDPALILLDDRLAVGRGRDLCRKLKNDPLTRRIPVVLVSAVKDLGEVAAACGANAYLPKPFDLDELVAITQRFSL